MTVPLPDYPRLHALLGDAVRDLPNALAETMEDALCDAAESTPRPAFFSALESLRMPHCADGRAWTELRLSAARGQDLARATRTASGLAAVLSVLHAAHVAREEEGPATYPGSDVVDGLFRAGAALVEQVERCLAG